MIKSITYFFQKSIRNKLMVALPLAICFILLFMFTLTIFSLRKEVVDQLIQDGKQEVSVLSSLQKKWGTIQRMSNPLFSENMLYVQEYDRNGRLIFERSVDPAYVSIKKSTVEKILEEKEGVAVRKMKVKGESFLEFERLSGSNRLILGVSLAPVKKLLFSQTMVLLAICFITVISIAVIVASMGHLVSDPVKKLADEASELATEENALQPLQFQLAGRHDEVGLLASKLNFLLETIGSQQKLLADIKVDAAIGKMVSQVIHDLASPLHSINVARDYLIKMKTDDPYFSDHMRLLELGSNRLNSVAMGLLDQHKNAVPEKDKFYLHEIVQQLGSEYQLQCKDLLLKTELPVKSIALRGSQIALQRAFANIIKNAVEAMEGKGEIEVAAEQREADVHISISDNGPGMSEATLQKILHGGHSEGKSNGHGIGMKVVRETVEDFGGTLSATSVLGVGTKFSITLPLAAG